LQKHVSTEISTEVILKAKTLNSLMISEGKDFVYDIVDYFITDLCTFFNPVRNMNARQIAQTTALIIELYDGYKIEDFIKCFKNIKAMKYGKFFEGIDGGKIIDMIHQYYQEREADIEAYQANKSNEHKALSKQEYNEAILPVLKTVAEKLDLNKPKETVKRELTENEIRIQNWFNEFDEINRAQNHKNESIRFIVYNGKKITQDEYITLKIEEL